MQKALQELREAFSRRQKPAVRVFDKLHPADREDALDCCADLEAGKSPSLIFQSAIPYYAFFTDEFRSFLFPDYLATLLDYPCSIFSVIVELEGGRGKNLLSSFTPEEHAAASRFVLELSQNKEMEFYLEEIAKLSDLLKEANPR